MAQRSELATINQGHSLSVIPTADEWRTIHQMAQALLPTGFLPNSIKTAEQATAIILKGRELNVPAMYSLSNIVVVQGKPTCSAELMLALVHRDHGVGAMWVEESTNESCTVGYRVGQKEKFYTFTIEDARRANLMKNQVWNAYPAAMLRARCISATARMAFPGSIAGMYVAGELGDPVDVDEDGVVVSISAPQRGENENQSPTPHRVEEAPQRQAQRVTAELVDEGEAWQTASSHFHAVLNEVGINEEGKREWLAFKGFASTKDVPAETLHAWAHQIKDRPVEAKNFIEGRIASKEQDDQLNPGEDELPTPEGLQDEEPERF